MGNHWSCIAGLMGLRDFDCLGTVFGELLTDIIALALMIWSLFSAVAAAVEPARRKNPAGHRIKLKGGLSC